MPPAAEYLARLDARRNTHVRLLQLDARLSYWRLAVFVAAAVTGWLAWRGILHPAWVVAVAIAFVALVKRHDTVIRERQAAARAIGFYERGLARIEDRWMGSGESGERFRDEGHLYANDLDLFGRGSLFELLSIARTRAGEETLASWLTRPAQPPAIAARRAGVEELTPMLDLREALAMAGADIRAEVHTEALTAWAAAPDQLRMRRLRPVFALLTAAAVAAAAAWAIYDTAWPLVNVVVLQALISWPVRKRIDHVLHAVSQPSRDLDVLADVLQRLEPEHFESPRLAELCASLAEEGRNASQAIGSLRRLSEAHDWQHNLIFAMVSAPLMWGTHLAYAIESWRRRHGPHVARWLATVGEFEAFSSLSAYRYEHPDDVFADLVEEGPARFEGEALGHPLIPTARMVANDVHLGGPSQLLVVSGSNMSGKSTLLRTVGINAVLALAGAPVRAASLRLTPLAVGATLRIQDSLQEGRSRFFAEITRVRSLASLATGSPPLLFLLDELFHGTNSHDRLVGATGVLRSLLDRGAIGLITTHDLALTQIAADVGPRAVNVHFEDRFESGEIRFDYRMKSGPVTHSNALALMRAVGLDVEQQ